MVSNFGRALTTGLRVEIKDVERGICYWQTYHLRPSSREWFAGWVLRNATTVEMQCLWKIRELTKSKNLIKKPVWCWALTRPRCPAPHPTVDLLLLYFLTSPDNFKRPKKGSWVCPQRPTECSSPASSTNVVSDAPIHERSPYREHSIRRQKRALNRAVDDPFCDRAHQKWETKPPC